MGPHVSAARSYKERRLNRGRHSRWRDRNRDGHRNKDPKRFEMKTERVTWNSRTFNVYPDRK